MSSCSCPRLRGSSHTSPRIEYDQQAQQWRKNGPALRSESQRERHRRSPPPNRPFFSLCAGPHPWPNPNARSRPVDHLCVMREILEHCPDTVEIADKEDRNVVHLALKCGPSHSKEVLRLPELVRLVNDADGCGDTPLHAATKDQNYRMVKKLLTIPGVDLRAKNADGLTFLGICESRWQYTKKKVIITSSY